VWEIWIKRSLGKLAVPEEYLSLLLEAGVQPLAVSVAHAAGVAQLPPHHRDPFDRLLVAQALTEPARLYTADPALPPYSELVTLVP
jgi:PIN domain nuclease of toxin-antitoxin system